MRWQPRWLLHQTAFGTTSQKNEKILNGVMFDWINHTSFCHAQGCVIINTCHITYITWCIRHSLSIHVTKVRLCLKMSFSLFEFKSNVTLNWIIKYVTNFQLLVLHNLTHNLIITSSYIQKVFYYVQNPLFVLTVIIKGHLQVYSI